MGICCVLHPREHDAEATHQPLLRHCKHLQRRHNRQPLARGADQHALCVMLLLNQPTRYAMATVLRNINMQKKGPQ